MSETEYSFQTDLKNSIFNADPKLDRNELLTDIFKSYVAKLFEMTLKKGRLPYDALVTIKANLISEFRNAELSEYQKSVEWYEKTFDETIKEILAIAASRHRGVDQVVSANQTLQINPEIYMNEKGLTIPVSAL